MAFAAGSTVYNTMLANKRVAYGTFTQASDTGGDIATGLSSVEYAEATHATAITASGGTISVTTGSGAPTSGYWMAIGT
jgi:hypothetical protein